MNGYGHCGYCDMDDVYISELHDARGIYCGSACEKCMPKLEAKFRPEVLADPNYEHDEPIEEEDPERWSGME